MKYFFFSLFFIFSVNCSGQNYLPYFKAIATAESLLVDSNIHEAVSIYATQFNSNAFIFPKDAYIAAQAAAVLGYDSLCHEFICRGLTAGLDTQTLHFNPYTQKWWLRYGKNRLISAKIDSLNAIYKSRRNTELLEKIIPLIKQDQKLRDKNESYLNAVVFKHRLRPRLFKKWMAQADSQAVQLIAYTRQFGFPSHKTIGCNDAKLYRKFGTNMRSTYATVILFHANHAWELFKNDVEKQLELGNITPKQVALLRDFATRHFIYEHTGDTAYADYKYFVRWRYNVENWDSIYAQKKKYMDKRKSTEY